MGTVGFDIVEMPWTRAFFDTDKAFLLRTIEHAKTYDNWDILNYEPSKAHLLYALEGLEKLVKRLSVDKVDEQNYLEWAEDFGCISICDIHGIIQHKEFGCKLCNEAAGLYHEIDYDGKLIRECPGREGGSI